MPDPMEPTSSELERLIRQLREDVKEGNASMNARLDTLVTRDAFLAEQRRLDERFTHVDRHFSDQVGALTKDIQDEREARLAGDADQQKELEAIRVFTRWMIAAVIVPIVLFALTIWLNTGGTTP